MSDRLSFRIALAVAILALFGAGIVSLVSYIKTQASEQANAQRTLRQLGLTVQRTATIATYLDNQEIADDAIQGLAENDLVAAITLTSVNGLNISYGDSSAHSASPASIISPGSPVRVRLISPFTPDEVVGELLIYPRQEQIDRNARAAALERAGLLGGYTLVIAMVVMFVIQWQFVPTLKQVAANLHGIRPGSNDRLSMPTSHAQDELGALVGDINQLLALAQENIESERQLRQQIESLERRFRLIFERASAGIFLIDSRGRLIMTNPAFIQIVGDSINSRIVMQDVDCLTEIFADPESVRSIVQRALNNEVVSAEDLRLAGLEEEPRWVHSLFSRIVDDAEGHPDGQHYVQGILTDITRRKREEQLMRFHAERDPLTQLHNRRSAERELSTMLSKSRAVEGCLAICLIDLDNFKPINDTHGHEAGDKVLVTVAARMQGILRSDDLAARLGGDEFLVAVLGQDCRQMIEAVARKLLDTLTQDIELENGTCVRVGASLGIALSGRGNEDIAQLLNLADQAMYRVKNRGKNSYHIYQPV